jgi:hypothetical protein
MKGKTGKMAPKKMQVGGATMDQRAANRASNAAKRQAGFDTRMAAEKARRQPGRDAFRERMAAARARRASRASRMG